MRFDRRYFSVVPTALLMAMVACTNDQVLENNAERLPFRIPDRLVGADQTQVDEWANGYYQAIDAPATYGEWRTRYGMDQAPGAYFFKNLHDFPDFFLRDTQCNEIDGRLACANNNYVCAADCTKFVVPAFEVEDTDDRCMPLKRCGLAAVVMMFDTPPGMSHPFTQFIVYAPGVGPETKRSGQLNLDLTDIGLSPHEVNPNLCNSCHGGEPYSPRDPSNPTEAELDMNAQFIPILPKYYDYGGRGVKAPITLDPIFPLSGNEVSGDPAAFATERLQYLKGLMLDNPRKPTPAVREVYRGNDLYPPAEEDRTNPPNKPPSWPAGKLYQLVAENCTDRCHATYEDHRSLYEFSDFVAYRDTIFRDICDCSMPHSLAALDFFGQSDTENFRTEFLTTEAPGWPALGACPPDSKAARNACPTGK